MTKVLPKGQISKIGIAAESRPGKPSRDFSDATSIQPFLLVALYFSDFRIGKAKFHCADNAVHLFWIASADDSAGYSRMAQRPSNSHFTGRPAVPAAHNP